MSFDRDGYFEGKRRKLAKTFFQAGVILWWHFMTETNQVSFIWFTMLSAPSLRCLSHYSCLFDLKQIKNQTGILWYNFDFADVMRQLSNFREVGFFYLFYLVLFWKMHLHFQRRYCALQYGLCNFEHLICTWY